MSKVERELERRIVKAAIDSLIKSGFCLQLERDEEDGEFEIHDSSDATLDEVFACDEERIYVYLPDGDNPYGWVFLVFGGDGWDVISDYSTNLDKHLKEANALAESYA